MPERKNSQKMTAAQKEQLVALFGKVMTSRYPTLQTLSKDELVSWAAYLELALWCEGIARDKAREKKVNSGGRKATKEAIESKRLVQNALIDLLLAGQEITFNSIQEQLAKYPEVRDAKPGDEPYSDYAVKEYLAAYRKLLHNPSLNEGG